MRGYRILIVCALGAMLCVPSIQASNSEAGGPGVFGLGRLNATDDFGGYFPNAGPFALLAGVTHGGRPFGFFSFVGEGDFVSAWGACPYDPRCKDYPNTNTQIFFLNGHVTSVVDQGDGVAISGLLTEKDLGQRRRVIFEESEVPFLINLANDGKSLVLKFCEVPPFTMDINRGFIWVQKHSPSPTLFQRPAPQPEASLNCHAPLS